MIYTITFNPALDYITQVENFKIGEINRTKQYYQVAKDLMFPLY